MHADHLEETTSDVGAEQAVEESASSCCLLAHQLYVVVVGAIAIDLSQLVVEAGVLRARVVQQDVLPVVPATLLLLERLRVEELGSVNTASLVSQHCGRSLRVRARQGRLDASVNLRRGLRRGLRSCLRALRGCHQ